MITLDTLFQLKEGRGTTAVMEMSDATAAHLGIDGQKARIRVGSRQAVVPLRCETAPNQACLSLPQATLSELALSSPVARRFNVRIRRTSDGILEVGPVIGILIGLTRDQIRKNRHGYKIFHTLWNIKNIGGLAYFFTADNIDWEQNCVFGHVHFPADAPLDALPQEIPFETGYFPFPGAIYRRHHVPKETLNRIRTQMTPHVFNDSHALDKALQADILAAETALSLHVPETTALTAASIDEMLGRHSAIYLKRSRMGAGRAVFHLIRGAGDGYRITGRISTRSGEEQSCPIPSYAALAKALKDVTGYAVSSSTWCVQQAIKPAHWRMRPFDLRVTVQKNGVGRWTVNGAYARLAPAGNSVITRLGEYFQAKDLLQRRWPLRGRAIMRTALDFALACAESLDRQFDQIGDLGVDLLVDDRGKPWFLEANAGPGYRPVGSVDTDYWRQVAMPLTFASYLSGFPIDRLKWPRGPEGS